MLNCVDVQIFGGDAIVAKNSDYMVFNAWWSSGHYITWTRSNNMYKTYLQYLNGEELIEEAYKESKESGDRCKKMVEYINSTIE